MDCSGHVRQKILTWAKVGEQYSFASPKVYAVCMLEASLK